MIHPTKIVGPKNSVSIPIFTYIPINTLYLITILSHILLYLVCFLEFLNQNDWGIRLDSQFSQSRISFLDLEIYIEDLRIKTRTHFKNVDVNSYIEKTSCHFWQWLEGVPKGQFLRLKRNCTEDAEYHTQSEMMKTQFEEKGYDGQVLEKVRKQTSQIDQKQILNKRKTLKGGLSNKVPFICQYSSEHKEIKRILKQYWPILIIILFKGYIRMLQGTL